MKCKQKRCLANTSQCGYLVFEMTSPIHNIVLWTRLCRCVFLQFSKLFSAQSPNRKVVSWMGHSVGIYFLRWHYRFTIQFFGLEFVDMFFFSFPNYVQHKVLTETLFHKPATVWAFIFWDDVTDSQYNSLD